MRYFIELAYQGAAYSGWQRQPNAPSVQQTIEEALGVLLKSEIVILGAGRTDAGVHARQMFAHCDIETAFDPEQLKDRLNSYLPADIVIYRIFAVSDQAHARFDATARTYEYWVTLGKDPFLSEGAYALHRTPDFDLMNQVAQKLLSHRDFQCFSKSKTDVMTYNCVVRHAQWTQVQGIWVFTITADRFLRNMVRAVVGTLLEVGLGKMEVAEFDQVLESKNRSAAGPSVPGHALYLTKIDYPETLGS
jgi:tRNA pseudouridine38-40 synthase